MHRATSIFWLIVILKVSKLSMQTRSHESLHLGLAKAIVCTVSVYVSHRAQIACKYQPVKDVRSRITGLKIASASAVVERKTFDGPTKVMPSTYTKNFDTFAGDRQAKTTVIDTSDPECHARGTI